MGCHFHSGRPVYKGKHNWTMYNFTYNMQKVSA